MKKRFIIEYANNKIDRIYNDANITESEKISRCRVVTRTVFYVENSLITIDDAMMIIAKA